MEDIKEQTRNIEPQEEVQEPQEQVQQQEFEPPRPEAPDYSDKFNTLEEKLSNLDEKLSQNKNQPLTEEEEALAQLRDKLGLSKIEELENKLKQYEEREQKRQEAQRQAKIESDRNVFLQNKPPNAEELVVKELQRLKSVNPSLAQELYNAGLEGWNYIYNSVVDRSAPRQQPDNITQTSNGFTNNNSNAVFDKIKKGEDVDNIAVGNAILDKLNNT
jgi:hypothetical protein